MIQHPHDADQKVAALESKVDALDSKVDAVVVGSHKRKRTHYTNQQAPTTTIVFVTTSVLETGAKVHHYVV